MPVDFGEVFRPQFDGAGIVNQRERQTAVLPLPAVYSEAVDTGGIVGEHKPKAAYDISADAFPTGGGIDNPISPLLGIRRLARIFVHSIL